MADTLRKLGSHCCVFGTLKPYPNKTAIDKIAKGMQRRRVLIYRRIWCILEFT